MIFGGAGRAYDRTLYDYLQLEQTKFALATSELRFNTADHPCTPSASCVAWDPVYAQDPGAILALFNGMAGEVNLINNDLEVPYSDQFSLGLRSRLADWNTSIAVTRIESKDGFVFTMGNRYPNGDFWQNRSQPWGNSPPGLAGVLLIGDSGIETESTQVLLSADKPFTEESRWGTTFSYTYTDADHNRNINEHYAFDQVSINEYPFVLSNAAPKHRVVATGTYSAPWGLMLAAKLTWATPIPRNISFLSARTAVFPNGAPCTEFAYELGSSDGYQSLDLQITKNFELRDFASFYLRFDILNATNEENLVDYVDDERARWPDCRRQTQPRRQHHGLSPHRAGIIRREVLNARQRCHHPFRGPRRPAEEHRHRWRRNRWLDGGGGAGAHARVPGLDPAHRVRGYRHGRASAKPRFRTCAPSMTRCASTKSSSCARCAGPSSSASSSSTGAVSARAISTASAPSATNIAACLSTNTGSSCIDTARPTTSANTR